MPVPAAVVLEQDRTPVARPIGDSFAPTNTSFIRCRLLVWTINGPKGPGIYSLEAILGLIARHGRSLALEQRWAKPHLIVGGWL